MANFIIENGILVKYTGTDTDVIIPDEVTAIGEGAFFQCVAMKSFTVGGNIKSIDAQAFKSCTGLENIILPNGVTNIGHEAFLGCKSVRNIVIPDSVTNIDVFAFALCNSLQSLTIGNGIQHISKSAFPGKMRLSKCVLAPDSQDEEQGKILMNALKTENLAFPFLFDAMETNDFILKKLKSQITSKKFREEFVPSLIRQNDSAVFAKLLSLIKKMPAEEIDTYIEKAQNSAEIKAMLMEYKNRLYTKKTMETKKEIQMEKDSATREKSLADYRKNFKIVKDDDIYKITGYKGESETIVIPASIKGLPVVIADKAFENCARIREVLIENGVKSIGACAFKDCTNLHSVSIPDSVTAIGDYVFTGCSALKTAALPNGLTVISDYTFHGCSTLQSINIPQNVTKIGYSAFRFCKNLQTVSIPDSVTEIADAHAFYACDHLTILCSDHSYARQYAQQNGIPSKIQ